MPRIRFTGHLHRLAEAADGEVSGRTVREALEVAFARNPALRGYVLDDQGALRRHVIVFVGGEPVRDRQGLSDPISPGAEVSVLQALSGG